MDVGCWHIHLYNQHHAQEVNKDPGKKINDEQNDKHTQEFYLKMF